jgi:pSer/pThr/pTyr-binding forkhead associated (FHA) protein
VRSVPAGAATGSLSPASTTATVLTSAPISSGSRLVVLAGPLSGQVFPLDSGEVHIGRELGREICLSSDSTVSRHHALIQNSSTGLILQDEGSSNGTYVNGARITSQRLSPGDEIRIGSSLFRVE